MVSCLICSKDFKNNLGLAGHLSRTHKIKSIDYTIRYIFKGEIPLCSCGCGEKTLYNQVRAFEFNRFILGHTGFVENHWGDLKAREKHDKKGITRKKKFELGELLVSWEGKKCVDLYGQTWVDNRSAKILKKYDSKRRSEVLSGIKKSVKHVENWKKSMMKYWKDPEFCKRLSDLKAEYLQKEHKHYTSRLEKQFEEEFLIPKGIFYKRFFRVREIGAYYDFYIPNKNTIIEIDGDFWHCNPLIFDKPKYKCQFNNIEKDKIKTDWCKSNNITLIRIWEYSIHNDKDIVKSIVLNLL